ncbi:MAG: hypothetical protein IGBAC_0199 [Ignavibacteriae bacterium]|nr:MAG: hypothetical protein IGBAC_0199 [Ignavibacteriota bacterium]
MTATPSLKLCIASEIKAKLPEIIPPTISVKVTRKLSAIVIKSRLLDVIYEFSLLCINKYFV